MHQTNRCDLMECLESLAGQTKSAPDAESVPDIDVNCQNPRRRGHCAHAWYKEVATSCQNAPGLFTIGVLAVAPTPSPSGPLDEQGVSSESDASSFIWSWFSEETTCNLSRIKADTTESEGYPFRPPLPSPSASRLHWWLVAACRVDAPSKDTVIVVECIDRLFIVLLFVLWEAAELFCYLALLITGPGL